MSVIAIDVDLTVVDSLNPWLDWFNERVGADLEHAQLLQYNLAPIMRQQAAKQGHFDFDPYVYWKQPDLYDKLEPLGGAVDIIKKLNRLHTVVWVSHCFPEHENSKINFLRKFGENIPFISTQTKKLVAFDVIIDDNLDILNTIHDGRFRIQYNELSKPWTRNETVGDLLIDKWDSHIVDVIRAEELGRNRGRMWR